MVHNCTRNTLFVTQGEVHKSKDWINNQGFHDYWTSPWVKNKIFLVQFVNRLDWLRIWSVLALWNKFQRAVHFLYATTRSVTKIERVEEVVVNWTMPIPPVNEVDSYQLKVRPWQDPIPEIVTRIQLLCRLSPSIWWKIRIKRCWNLPWACGHGNMSIWKYVHIIKLSARATENWKD